MIVRSLESLHALDRSGRHVVIVGAGTIGLFLAKLLVEKGRRVTIVECGVVSLDSFSSEGFRNVGKPHQGTRIGRSRSIGGTSNLWGGQLVEFMPADFRGRPWLPTSAWPIGADEMKPFCQRAFQRLGIEPEAQDDEPVWQGRLGSSPRFADDVEIVLTRRMKTPSMAVLYADDIHSDPRLMLLAGHTTVGFQAAGSRVTGVVIKTPDDGTAHLEGDEIIVAAGTVETVRLLLAAQADRSSPCPWQTNRMLGLRFQDHLGGRIGTVMPLDKQRLFRVFSTLYWIATNSSPNSGSRKPLPCRISSSAHRASYALRVPRRSTSCSSSSSSRRRSTAGDSLASATSSGMQWPAQGICHP